MPLDRDEHVPKHPRAHTSPVVAVTDPETSGAIEDPDARHAWREANRTLTERVTRTETRLDDVAEVASRTEGMVTTILTNSQASAEEREYRKERELRASIARRDRERLDRRNKIAVGIVAGVFTVVIALVKAFA